MSWGALGFVVLVCVVWAYRTGKARGYVAGWYDGRITVRYVGLESRGLTQDEGQALNATYDRLFKPVPCESCQQLRSQLDAELRKNAAWAEISGARDLAGEEET